VQGVLAAHGAGYPAVEFRPTIADALRQVRGNGTAAQLAVPGQA
jgi:hypothetical protein